jgi:hypothetical protein
MAVSMAAFYPFILFLHGLTRWLVLVGGLWLVLASITSLGRSGPVGASPVQTPWRVYMGGLHLQFLLGLVLLFISPLALATWSDMGAAMKVRPMRFFTIEHTTMMIAALGVASVGNARVRRAIDARGAARTSLVFGAISLLLILAAIPWPFMGAIARPWLRSW